MKPVVKASSESHGGFHRFAFTLAFKRQHKDDMVRLTSAVRDLVHGLRTNDPEAFVRFTVKNPFDPAQIVVDVLIGLSCNLAKPLAERIAEDAILHLRCLLGVGRERKTSKNSKQRLATKKKR